MTQVSNTPVAATDVSFDDSRRLLESLRAALNRTVVGQDALVEHVVTALFAGGHVLIEGLPGLGKTQLAKGLAASLGLPGTRVQCTPDLMPSDITGTEVIGAGGQFEFRPGPVFSEFVLVDEINRATPRAQSALLEAMQERQVTHAGVTRRLPEPFHVLATQNPIDLEGTYPLPEAQLDRFLFKLSVPYPTRHSLRALLDVALDAEPAEALKPICNGATVLGVIERCRSVLISERCKSAAVDLILATQPASEGPARFIRFGASPRALQALIRAARVRAVMAGRSHLDVEDIAAVALPVLSHRVLLRFEGELDGSTEQSVLEGLIQAWRSRL